MHRTYIIIFEIAQKADKDKIVEYLKSFLGWARITENSFAVKTTDLKARDIRDHLLEFISDGDRLFVSKSGVEASWKNTRGRSQWFKENL